VRAGTLLDRFLWGRVLTDKFHDDLQQEYDKSIVIHQNHAFDSGIRDAIQECDRLLDELEAGQKKFQKRSRGYKDLACRAEGVLLIKDVLLEKIDGV
jgi:hypothetical protein